MEPARAPSADGLGRLRCELRGDASALPVLMHAGVQNEGVLTAIPGHVDEAHKHVPVVGSYVGQAAIEHGAEARWAVVTPGRAPEWAHDGVGGDRIGDEADRVVTVASKFCRPGQSRNRDSSLFNQMERKN